MARVIPPEMVETVTGALLGAATVDDGPTDEQRAVIAAVVGGYWQRPDLDLGTVTVLSPADTAAAVTDPAHRRRVRELMVLVELCRHPLSDAQVQRVEDYAAAMGEEGAGLTLARTLVRDGADAATADYGRFLETIGPATVEPEIANMGTADDDANAELATRLRALHDLPPETLGYAFVEFYRRNGIALPGENPEMPAVFVSHDMCHVIAGYEPIGQGEIALGAMQLSVDDTDAHWLQFLGNLGIHEAGFLGAVGFVPKTASLTRPGATAMLARAFTRGSQCTGDFTTADHLALVDVPLADVRAMFGVPPLDEDS